VAPRLIDPGKTKPLRISDSLDKLGLITPGGTPLTAEFIRRTYPDFLFAYTCYSSTRIYLSKFEPLLGPRQCLGVYRDETGKLFREDSAEMLVKVLEAKIDVQRFHRPKVPEIIWIHPRSRRKWWEARLLTDLKMMKTPS